MKSTCLAWAFGRWVGCHLESARQHSVVVRRADEIFPDLTIGRDGFAFSLPANSDEIIQSSDGL